jgi:hypothetical protein
MSVVEDFAWLFRGRIDAYGSWEGRCVREPLTPAIYEQHLTSTDPADWVGVYPLGKNMCTWGCIDIDGGDYPRGDARQHPDYNRKHPQWHDWDRMLELANDLVVVLNVKGVHGHVERTRNGYHVWVFPEDKLVTGRVMRRALMAACTAIGYKPNEVNPKQEALNAGEVGNYVRLPYHGALSGLDTVERRFVADDYTLGVEQFCDWATPTPTANLEACAELWRPPTKTWTVDVNAGMSAEPTVRKLNALGYVIWRDGPLPASDRSSTLAHLAHLCHECDLTADEAFVVVRSADERHGRKFTDREDGEQRIAEMIERAYAV